MFSRYIARLFQDLVVPKYAIIVYQDTGNKEYYLESRKIDREGKFLAAKPLTNKFVESLVKNLSFSEDQFLHGYIPPNMIYCDPSKGFEKYIWHNPPRKQMMYFKKELGIKDGEYYLPGIVFMAVESHLSVYAYQDKNLTPESLLYKAPFFNVNGGHVCLGNAHLPYPLKPTLQQIIEYWEQKFWMSRFSHWGDRHPTKDNLAVVVKNSKKKFDNSQLVPFRQDNSHLTLKILFK